MKKGFTHESTYNESKEWYTPRFIFQALDLDFDLDPCSPGQEIVSWIPAQIHYTFKDNGLVKKWFGTVFMNPPYGMDTPQWFRKLALHNNGIGLVFARTDTRWFHEYIPLADLICFIKGRVQFVRADDALYYADGLRQTKGGCGAASMLVAFGVKSKKALLESNLGLCFQPVRDAQLLSKHSELFRKDKRFAGDKIVAQQSTAFPYENLPRNAERNAGQLLEL